ncbi:MAG TPA: exodeoxyribonuclease VII small subunit [Alphaproteobacteria bacterium]|nr:exodeoxyribonuclease VII small subunit [Alphaproteobacteria bacterium]
MAETSIPPDVAKLGFEEALKELEDIVRDLEGGKGKLDDAIRSYERGAALKRHCENKLAEAQMRIDKIMLGTNGEVKAEPTDLR